MFFLALVNGAFLMGRRYNETPPEVTAKFKELHKRIAEGEGSPVSQRRLIKEIMLKSQQSLSVIKITLFERSKRLCEEQYPKGPTIAAFHQALEWRIERAMFGSTETIFSSDCFTRLWEMKTDICDTLNNLGEYKAAKTLPKLIDVDIERCIKDCCLNPLEFIRKEEEAG